MAEASAVMSPSALARPSTSSSTMTAAFSMRVVRTVLLRPLSPFQAPLAPEAAPTRMSGVSMAVPMAPKKSMASLSSSVMRSPPTLAAALGPKNGTAADMRARGATSAPLVAPRRSTPASSIAVS
jgi:hypothetical protein